MWEACFGVVAGFSKGVYKVRANASWAGKSLIIVVCLNAIV